MQPDPQPFLMNQLPGRRPAWTLTRRGLIATALTAATGGLLAACAPAPAAPGAPSQPVSAAPPTTTAAAGAVATSTPVSVRPVQASGLLRVALENNFPDTLDATKTSYQLIRVGLAETLTRLTAQNKIVPWLAREVAPVDPSTWRVALRPNAKFWDDSPVTAQAVLSSFQSNWGAYPAANGLLSKDTQIKVVDSATLEFTTPEPMATFPNAVSAQFFAVHKNGTTMTGPYKPINLSVGQQLDAEAFAAHWDGVPPLAKLTVRLVTDGNARMLALRSGDIDFVYGVPPQAVKSLGQEFTINTVASGREDYIVLNHRRPPFNDRAVREATAFAVDRTALLGVGLAGQGTVATGMFPPDQGIPNLDMQATDPTRAKQLLDEAGWMPAADGVRVKDGQRLSFKLLSAPARTEWTPMAVALQGQLQAFGYDIQIERVNNIGDLLSQARRRAARSLPPSLIFDNHRISSLYVSSRLSTLPLSRVVRRQRRVCTTLGNSYSPVVE